MWNRYRVKGPHMHRNSSLDAGRTLAAFLVICLHLPIYWGPAQPFIHAIEGCAVPFFFMTSGYLLFPVENVPSAIRARAVRIARTLLVWCAICTAFFGLAYCLTGVLPQFVETLLSWETLYRSLFIVGGMPYASQLWFLLQLAVNYLLALLARRVPGVRRIWLWLPLSVVLGCIAVAVPSLGSALDWCDTLNFFAGAPWFFFGRLLAARESDIAARLRPRVLHIAATALLAARFALFLFPQGFAAAYAPCDRLTLTLLGACAFLLCLYHPAFAANSFLSRWGRAYSLPIYLLHTMVMEAFAKLVSWVPALFTAYCLAAPLYVFFACLLLSAAFARLRRALRSRPHPNGQGPC